MVRAGAKPPKTQAQRNARNALILGVVVALAVGWFFWNGSKDGVEHKLQNLDAADGHSHDFDAYKNTWSQAMARCTQTPDELETLIENVLPTLRQQNPANSDRLALLVNISLSVPYGAPKVDCAPLLSGNHRLTP